MKKIYAFTVVALLVVTGRTLAYDFLSSRGTSLGQATLLSNPAPSEMLNLPSGALERGEFRFETGLNRAYDLKDFDQFMMAASGRRGRFSLAAGFSQFGRSELYTEQTAKLTLAAHFDSLTLAAGVSHLLVGFGGNYADLSATTFHASTAFRYRGMYVGLGADNLTSPSLNDGSPKTNPIYVAEAEYRSSRRVSMLGRVQLQELERPRFSLAQHIGLGDKAALMLGVVTAPVQFGGGVEFSLKGGRLTYGMAIHPVLGLTQTLSISYGNRAQKAGARNEFK